MLNDITAKTQSLLAELYTDEGRDVADICRQFVTLVDYRRAERPEALRAFDQKTPAGWFKAAETVAYVLYADLFSPEAPQNHLNAMRADLDYLADLGLNLIHILPILKSSGDAGFAVDDYNAVDRRFGTTADFQALITACHQRGLRLALDFVLNHVSNNHPWAKAALNPGSPYHDYFIWADSGEPWPKVPDIFPAFAPGHWDYVPEADQWVWATFYKRRPRGYNQDQFSFAQWDLNYKNPAVLLGMLDYLLGLANWGVDLFRLDAVPFLWKETGTSCTSLPQIHTILKLIRLGLTAVAPRAALLAEANDPYEQLAAYFGQGDEVQIAYHFPLMPALWQAVTTGAVAGISQALTGQLDAIAQADHGHWWVFSECHDELTLMLSDDITARELSHYFLRSGGLPFRKVKGEDFLRGLSGTTFSLLRGDLRKILLLWQLKLSLGWTPLFYMGEELGLENDLRYQADPERREDSRFVKRVPLSRRRKDRRHQAGSNEAYLYHNLKRLIAWRKQHPCLVTPPDFFDTGSASVLGFTKQDEKAKKESMILLANCSDEPQTVTIPALNYEIHLKPFQFWWKTGIV